MTSARHVNPPATYVYCIVSSTQPLSTERTPPGPPGTGTSRLLEIRPRRYAVVSDAPVDEFGERPLAAHLLDLDWVSRAAVAHEAVVASFLTRADAVVPMKLFTLFSSDARAIDEMRSGWARIERLVRKLTKHEEWGVRLVYDINAAGTDNAIAAPQTGRNYLLAKRRERAAASAHSTAMRKAAADVLRTVRRLASDTRRREVTAAPDSRNRLLLDAALLVPRNRTMRFQAEVARHAKKLARGGYVLQLTGPWPPYSFTDNR